MKPSKSPFLVTELISPKKCEHLCDMLYMSQPDVDVDNVPQVMYNTSPLLLDEFESEVPRLQQLIQEHFNIPDCLAINIEYMWLPTGSHLKPMCSNSKLIDNKWARVNNHDFTGYLFLSDFNDNPPFDSDFEVYGGKLEMLQHGFSFNPTRGVVIVTPSGPHFAHAMSQVQFGNSHVIRFTFTSTIPYFYQPRDFPGNFKTWFADELE